jgi:hypothetical protein
MAAVLRSNRCRSGRVRATHLLPVRPCQHDGAFRSAHAPWGFRRGRRQHSRQGVVLLVVVSLLALFILLGVTYSLAVSQYVSASKLEKEIQRLGDTPDVETDRVLGVILYDTQARTVLQYHSLLRDLYGYDVNTISNTSSQVGGNYPQYCEAIGGLQSQLQATVFNVTNALSQGGQFYTFTFTLPVPNPNAMNPPQAAALSPIPNYYAGRVITFTKGACANQSTRIVAYQPGVQTIADLTANPVKAPTGTFTIEMIESKLAGAVAPSVGDTFIVNGAPFNGAGSGYNTATYGVDATYAAPDPTNPGPPPGQLSAFPIALLPNVAAYDVAPRGITNYALDIGGLDESWDAPDLQNMFLAMIPPRAAEAYYAGSPLPIIPSFHRPELINYWINSSTLAADTARSRLNTANLSQITLANMMAAEKDFLRTIIFRPMPWDHPNFTGSNPYFAAGLGVQQVIANLINSGNLPIWDVDNDGDGLPDSIWIDPGLPIVTTPDGRRYKRLAAILVKDLDGSINVNAAGNLAQTQLVNNTSYYYRADTPLGANMVTGYTPPQTPYPYALGLAQQGQYLPRGLGFGPAEMSFLNILNGDVTAYQNLMYMRYASNNPNDSGTTAAPGLPNYRDALAAIKHNGIPNDYANLSGTGTGPSWYASPPDVWGRGALCLDVGGQPIYALAAQYPNLGAIPPTYGEMIDSPYEIALSGEGNNADSPYTVAELERLLRYHDADSTQLPGRLLNAAGADLATGYPLNYPLPYYSLANPNGSEPPGVIGPSHKRRNMLTTLSSSLPVPETAIPQEMRQYMYSNMLKTPGSTSILDLYRWKLSAAPPLGGGLVDPQLTYEMQKIVPWEFFKGQKFDINRWLGDGLDNDSDFARDDPSESANPNALEYAWQTGTNLSLPTSFTPSTTTVAQQTNTVSVFGGGPPNAAILADNLYARQLYARHLFCLAMLFLPQQYQPNLSVIDPTLTPGVAGQPLYQTKAGRIMIRRIAQWAVNCVDFRDSDSIMTPFEFDYNPWDGWQVDGNLATDGSTSPEMILVNGTPTPQTFTAPSQRGLVWGMEQPDLLITETLAFHDRRVRDTNQDASGKFVTDPGMSDTTLDQLRVPQGSVFVELYNTRAYRWPGQLANQKPQLPGELYDLNTNSLMLGKLAPANPNTGVRRPVWRLAFSKIDRNNNAQLQAHPAAATGTQQPNPNPGNAFPETVSFEPSNMSLLALDFGSPPMPLNIERYAYFTNVGPNAGNAALPLPEQGQSFYNSTINALLQPGQYAVVGPRAITYIGSKNTGTSSGPAPFWIGNSNQSIQLSGAGGFKVTDTSGTTGLSITSRTVGNDMQQPVPIVCDMPGIIPIGQAGPWLKAPPWNIGLNITEPLPLPTQAVPNPNYYPPPDWITSGTAQPTTYPTDFYDDPNTPNKLYPDWPQDSPNGPTPSNRPLAVNAMTQTATYTDCSAVFLQRLADPTQPYNPLPGDPNFDFNLRSPITNQPIVNPYITVDWSTIDVTVFSGEENPYPSAMPPMGLAAFDTDDPPGGSIRFGSRQRGYLQAPPTGKVMTSNPWPPLTAQVTSYTPPNPWLPAPANYFNVNLSNSKAQNTNYDAANDRHTLGSLNSSVDYPQLNNAGANPYYGEPSTNPFPWVSWNNRPFSNAMELLCVPSSSPSRACFEMTPGYPPGNAAALTTGSPYDYSTGNPTSNPFVLHQPFGQQNPFGHLLNFFQTGPATPSATASTAPHLYRLLDFVEVPSPYAGAERWYNPQQFGGFTIPPAVNGYYRPPFNKLSRFRDPGKVNVNTIFDDPNSSATENVWDALVGQFPGMRRQDLFFQQLLLSRQGYTTVSVGSTVAYGINNNFPTRFANPIRPADSADLMPNSSFVPGMRKVTPVEASLLRPDPTSTSGTTWLPLFQINSNNATYASWIGPPAGSPPGTPSQGQSHDINRNPYFRYQELQKLGNMVTNHSNCFAVWVTIGYFEVETTTVDAAHPDGFQLSQEVGADSGEITRHRAFYIIDRSIPVGFLPGSRLNTDDCVLVRRLIE